MCAVKVLRQAQVELSEAQLQKAIEEDLSVLEEGLVYVASEVVIGTGRIDTLAVDEDDRPTFIEYKRAGRYDRNALIQSMDYISWFIKDRTHFLVLQKLIKTRKPEIEHIEPEIRLILVVSEIDDRVANACYVLKSPVQIFVYTCAKIGDDVAIMPSLTLDNAEIDEPPPEPTPEGELVKPPFEKLYTELKAFLLDLPGVKVYPTKRGVRAASDRVFAAMRFRKNWVRLSLRAGKHGITHPDFKMEGESPWGRTNIGPSEHLGAQTREWIQRAYEFSKGQGLPEEGEDESASASA